MGNSSPDSVGFCDLPQGFRLGAYTIMHKLGSGGMADVYFAMHEELHRPAAIKVLRPSLAADESNLQRFMQEARAAASLVHPNIVQVYDVGQQEAGGENDALGINSESSASSTANGSNNSTNSNGSNNNNNWNGPKFTVRYIAQEYVAGTNLRQYLEQHGTLSTREALSVLLQTLAALKKSSSVGIVHRDIKPENILLTADGDVKVTDFGLARLLHDDPQLTRAGTTLGTPMYMSPEQLQDGEVDVRSDLYSLGVTLFHMLAGKPPFAGETPLALAMQHVQATPPKLQELRGDVPKPLSRLVDRLLAKQPQDRFGNPDDVLAFLRQERKDGLAEHWPEQTIPLPGAQRSENAASPSPATLKLQAQLNRLRQRGANRWMRVAAAFLVSLLFLGIGAVIAQTRPRPSLFGDSKNMYVTVPKQSDVQQQYLYALFNQTPRNKYLWEAVPYFFPPSENAKNRLYAGKAWLQLARLLGQQKEKERNEAERLLKQIIEMPDMEELLKALAWMEVAVLAADRDDEQHANEALQQAASIRSKPLSTEDDMIFLDNVPPRFRQMFSQGS